MRRLRKAALPSAGLRQGKPEITPSTAIFPYLETPHRTFAIRPEIEQWA